MRLLLNLFVGGILAKFHEIKLEILGIDDINENNGVNITPEKWSLDIWTTYNQTTCPPGSENTKLVCCLADSVELPVHESGRQKGQNYTWDEIKYKTLKSANPYPCCLNAAINEQIGHQVGRFFKFV